jgi:Type II secretion system (T2SS), protein E, N-terminal domain
MRDLFILPLWPRKPGKAREKVCPGCGVLSGSGTRALWQRLTRRPYGTSLDGVLYCPRCLEPALLAQFSRLVAISPPSPPPNRMPLGLLMMARGKLTYTEILAALEAQRRARYGKIGEWFEKLGFATEQEVTAALALQWGCPVASSLEPDAITPAFRLPLAILETFHMLPLHHAPATNTLSIAFGERVDHAVLYAIEKMLHCRTQPCVGGRNSIAGRLDRIRHQPLAREFEFGPMHDAADMVRIASSYITKFGADQIQLDRFGPFLWLRLESGGSIMNLLFRLRIDPPHPRSTKLVLPPLPYGSLPDYERAHAGD